MRALGPRTQVSCSVLRKEGNQDSHLFPREDVQEGFRPRRKQRRVFKNNTINAGEEPARGGYIVSLGINELFTGLGARVYSLDDVEGGG
jgi:hypothetical protein